MGESPSLLRFRRGLFASVRHWEEFWAEIGSNGGSDPEEAPSPKTELGQVIGGSGWWAADRDLPYA